MYVCTSFRQKLICIKMQSSTFCVYIVGVPCCNDIGYPNPLDCYSANYSNRSLARTGMRVAFPISNSQISFQMPKTNEVREDKKYSNVLSTPNSAKTVSYQDFEIEKNAKNQAYAFILASGNTEAFRQFSDETHVVKNYHDLCVSLLLSDSIMPAQIKLAPQSIEDIQYLRDFNREDGKAMVDGINDLIHYFINQSSEIMRGNDKEAHQMLERIRFISSVKDIIYNLSKEE